MLINGRLHQLKTVFIAVNACAKQSKDQLQWCKNTSLGFLWTPQALKSFTLAPLSNYWTFVSLVNISYNVTSVYYNTLFMLAIIMQHTAFRLRGVLLVYSWVAYFANSILCHLTVVVLQWRLFNIVCVFVCVNIHVPFNVCSWYKTGT